MTKREVQTKLRAALRAASSGIQPTPRRVTVGAYLEGWLETSVRLRCRASTYDSYRDTVNRYIVPAIGQQPLAKLEPSHVAVMLADLTARGTLSPTTVRYCYVVLRIALGRAFKQGLVARDVATLIDPPARSRRETHPLSDAQARTFLESVRGDRLEALYGLALTTGMRQGEMLGLRWQDVSLDARSVTVAHTLQKGTRELGEPKSARARRLLRLGEMATASLRRHRISQAEVRLVAGRRWTDLDFVFTTANGTPLGSHNVTRYFQAALKRAGLPHQRFHDLRHASATLGLESGESLYEVSQRLGHANIATTGDIYSHVTPAMQDRSAARMDRILTG